MTTNTNTTPTGGETPAPNVIDGVNHIDVDIPGVGRLSTVYLHFDGDADTGGAPFQVLQIQGPAGDTRYYPLAEKEEPDRRGRWLYRIPKSMDYTRREVGDGPWLDANVGWGETLRSRLEHDCWGCMFVSDRER